MKKALKVLLTTAVVAVCLYFGFRRLDWAEARSALSSISWRAIGGALLFLAASFSLRIARWWCILRLLNPSLMFSSCAWPFLTGLALNNTVPLRAGDAARAFAFQRELGVRPMHVLGTVVTERVVDLAVLIGFFCVGLLLIPAGIIPEAFVQVCLAAGSAVVIAAMLLMIFPKVLGGIVERVLRLVRLDRWRDGVVLGWWRSLWEAVLLVRTPRVGAAVVLLTIGAWLLEGGLYATIAASIGLGIEGWGPYFALSTGTLATALPSAPGYVGTFDYFAMLGAMAYGARRAYAAVFAVAIHLILWLPVTLLGMGYLFVSRAGIRDFVSDIRMSSVPNES